LKHFILLFFPLIFFTNIAKPQKVKELSYPKNYFMFPIRPGQINHLSGSLGDLRTMHFHGGLDIKTEQRTGLPVYAAADGYIQEIRISTSGYGNGLYIKHPNGMTTVYGHLDSFAEEIYKYASIKRIETESFELSFKPEVNEIPIRKGQIIGLSGNSGGSGGPHLHFEIRNEFNNLLNPLYFGFDEIKDNLAPQIQSLIIKPLTISSRVNQKFGRQYFYPKSINSGILFSEPIKANGTIGLEIMAIDRMNYNNNAYGISCIEVLVNGIENFYYHLEKIPVEDSKDINVHIDYAMEKTLGKKYQRLYVADGNTELPIYKPKENAGKLKIEPGKTYDIEIKTWDSFENLSQTSFTIFGDTTLPSLNLKPTKLNQSIDYQVDENTLIINLKNCTDPTSTCELGINGKTEQLSIAYTNNNQATYLYDLRKGLPQFIEIGELQEPTNFVKTIPSNSNLAFKTENIKIDFNTKSLYDTLYLEAKNDFNSFQIGQATIPLSEPLEISYKTNGKYDTEKSAVYNIYGNSKKALNTTWKGNIATFKTKELGTFSILADYQPPTIKPVIKDSTQLAFRIFDDLSGIKEFKAFVNGQFVLMEYDYKKRLIWSAKKDSTNYFKGDIKLTVADNVGNSEIYESTIEEPLLPVFLPKIGKKNKKFFGKKPYLPRKRVNSKKIISKKKKRK
jgi:Peptidase family M23